MQSTINTILNKFSKFYVLFNFIIDKNKINYVYINLWNIIYKARYYLETDLLEIIYIILNINNNKVTNINK